MFKTIKYMPTFPDRFGSLQDTRDFMRTFAKWYNDDHKHSGLDYYTPDDVHTGAHREKKQNRDAVLAYAYSRNPNRFVKGASRAASAPEAVWNNKPKVEDQAMVG